MESKLAKCPKWLASHLREKGGLVTFSQFMDWALNDPLYGSYSSGKLNIGKGGDFVTSPSLSNDFAELLAVQLAEWFKDLLLQKPNIKRVSLVEIGPGEGDLSYDLLIALEKLSPDIFKKLELVLVEINNSMEKRQRKKLSCFDHIRIRWVEIDQLIEDPVTGIVLAHEILDALPVERVVLRNKKLYQLGVKLIELKSGSYIEYIDLPLNSNVSNLLEEYDKHCGVTIPPDNSSDGWNSELHINLDNWFNKVSSSLQLGNLLIIDYALESGRYYQSSRSSGTIASYSNQQFSSNILDNPGICDITSHLCIDTLVFEATKNKFRFIGETKQGLALLSLGLANRISSLRDTIQSELEIALNKRESLLSLVDPYGLGGFRWILFNIDHEENSNKLVINTTFLNHPTNS